MTERTMKGSIHAGLALVGLLELLGAKSRSRKFLLGCAIGWHCHATFYHWVLEH